MKFKFIEAEVEDEVDFEDGVEFEVQDEVEVENGVEIEYEVKD